ncbi:MULTISPECIES: hypothetical protein [unclassified Clostridioides]|uniref:hypothetical protein n=1 Tax=unclassified Clostridioides TaxID=2635829 RepID=UPI001D0F5F6D|nr:hypothetical protein [Clostridioides sp. ES-S-0049-03]MCC0678168.1 hypothetical protein [Clostridioides sp. ES-W-0018-02]MCC0712928.1 hypothetical protein [Clostridioides sp. ES-W-0017-02]
MYFPGLIVPQLKTIEKPSTSLIIYPFDYCKEKAWGPGGLYTMLACKLPDGETIVWGRTAKFTVYPGNSYKIIYTYLFSPDSGGSERYTQEFTIECQYKSTTPSISGVDGSLGSKSRGFGINYTITNEDSYTYTVKAYLNDVLFDTKQAVKDTQYTINVPDSLVLSLQLNSTNKIKIEVTGGYGVSAIYRNYTFTKSNNAPSISGTDENIGNKSKGFTLKYTVNDLDYRDTVNVVTKLNSTILENITNIEKNREKEIVLTDERILALPIGSSNTIRIVATDSNGASSRIYTFTRSNNLPQITVNEFNSTQVKFIVSDLDNNLNKIEIFLDDTLKETITSDLYLEKTFNYTLEDNAIHTIKIKVTDTNGASERLVSVSNGVQPPQIDDSLEDIANTVSIIKNSFINGKTHIINKLALKNVNATLNNTLVEIGEMIGTAFSSSDASVQDLMNQLTQANNTITQLNTRFKVSSGRTDSVYTGAVEKVLVYNAAYEKQFYNWITISNLSFKPNIFYAECDYVNSFTKSKNKLFVFACCDVPTFSNKDFVFTCDINLKTTDNDYTTTSHGLYYNNKLDVKFTDNLIHIPAFTAVNADATYFWRAIKIY